MKGVILAGGHGTRLRPLTATRQKQLLPVANRPVIEYVIEGLVAAGVDEIAVIVGGTDPEAVRAQVTHTRRPAATITVIDQGEPRGLADAVACAEAFVGGEPFVVAFGDTILDTHITAAVVDRFDPTRSPLFLPVQRVTEPSRFGIVEFDRNEPVAVHEKPTAPPSNSAYMGIVGFTPAVFDCIADLTPSARGELELTAAIDSLIQQHDAVQWAEFDGTWIDVGTQTDLLAANSHILDRLTESAEADSRHRAGGQPPGKIGAGKPEIGAGTTVSPEATLIGPVSIGEDVQLGEGAEIGPHVSIADGCTVESASVTRSVLLESVEVTNADLRDSVLGERSVVAGLDGTARLVVGADSVLRSAADRDATR